MLVRDILGNSIFPHDIVLMVTSFESSNIFLDHRFSNQFRFGQPNFQRVRKPECIVLCIVHLHFPQGQFDILNGLNTLWKGNLEVNFRPILLHILLDRLLCIQFMEYAIVF